MIRTLNIARHLFNILRPQYALNYVTQQLNNLYRFLLACLYPLVTPEKNYEKASKKYYALAANDGSSISIAAYLNYYYGQYGSIYFGAPAEKAVTMYTYGDGEAVLFSPYGPSGAVSMYEFSGPVKIQPSTIYIPSELSGSEEYSDFTADLNALLILGVKANVITY